MARGLIRACAIIDRINLRVGAGVRWLVPVICIVTVMHGLSRRLFSLASNHVSEAQWYMFAAIFMLGAGYTLLRDEHVRIDIVSQSMPRRARLLIEAGPHLILVLPICLWLVWFTSGMCWASILLNEGPPDVVIGLPRWLLIAFMPGGFLLLGLQALSEGLKALLRLAGHEPVLVVAPGLGLGRGQDHGVETTG
jgi:TRAP-type mannitol/chloroaromatic compound transport system permease small subunit